MDFKRVFLTPPVPETISPSSGFSIRIFLNSSKSVCETFLFFKRLFNSFVNGRVSVIRLLFALSYNVGYLGKVKYLLLANQIYLRNVNVLCRLVDYVEPFFRKETTCQKIEFSTELNHYQYDQLMKFQDGSSQSLIHFL